MVVVSFFCCSAPWLHSFGLCLTWPDYFAWLTAKTAKECHFAACFRTAAVACRFLLCMLTCFRLVVQCFLRNNENFWSVWLTVAVCHRFFFFSVLLICAGLCLETLYDIDSPGQHGVHKCFPQIHSLDRKSLGSSHAHLNWLRNHYLLNAQICGKWFQNTTSAITERLLL